LLVFLELKRGVWNLQGKKKGTRWKKKPMVPHIPSRKNKKDKKWGGPIDGMPKLHRKNRKDRTREKGCW